MEILSELKKFNITDSAIAEMKEQFMPLIITGLDDKDGLKKVHDARIIVRNKRIEVEKKGKELRADANAFNKAVLAEENRIVKMLEPIESHLQSQEDIIEQEKERIRAEKEKIEQERIQKRINRLINLKMQFDGSAYSFGDLSIQTIQVSGFTNEQFDEFLLKIEAAKETERLRIEAEEAAKKKELEQFYAKKAEQEIREKELAEKEAAIKAAQEKIDVENLRIENERLAAEAKAKREADEKLRQEELQKAREEAAEKARIAEQDRIKKEEADRIQKEKIAAEKLAKKERMRPDKDKLNAYLSSIETQILPELKSEEYKTLVNEFVSSMQVLINATRIKIETL